MKMRSHTVYFGVLLTLILITLGSLVEQTQAQAGFDDDRVMIQGFYWESYRHGHPTKFPEHGSKRWYTLVKENSSMIREGLFDLIWLPPPSFAGQHSAGYNPKELYNLTNSYGEEAEHKAMLHQLLQDGIEPVADIVVNHRDGRTKWADFENPRWDTTSICADDESFSNQNSEVFNTPLNARGAQEGRPSYRQESNYRYDSFRDIDHSNPTVRRDILRFLLMLKSAGYRGWRYDMVHGYDAKWISVYNLRSQPTFAVGEYDWDKHSQQRGWVWATATTPGNLRTACSVFDFTTQFTLKDNKDRYSAWYGFGNGTGMIGDTTDGHAWKNRAVTFLENHDTGYRTNDDGTPQNGHKFDSFANGWEVEQAYAYILTHPGLPCVYWKHYFDWGDSLRARIKALINARKIAGVKSGSAVHLQQNAQSKGIYAARIDGTNGALYVRVGGTDQDWEPHFSNYHDYRDYAHGAGWKVWVQLPGNPPVKHAAFRAPFAIPDFVIPTDIDVPAEWLAP